MPRGPAQPTANRTDLQVPKLPAGTTAPDQEYGKRTGQAQSMEMQPIGGTPTPPVVTTPPSGGAGAPGAGGPPQPSRIGKMPWMEPTTHGLPATHGLPYGPGAGPEALTGPAAQWHAQQVSENGTLQQLLGSLAARPGASSAVRAMAANAGAQ